jgi:hypothetical protein
MLKVQFNLQPCAPHVQHNLHILLHSKLLSDNNDEFQARHWWLNTLTQRIKVDDFDCCMPCEGNETPTDPLPDGFLRHGLLLLPLSTAALG